MGREGHYPAPPHWPDRLTEAESVDWPVRFALVLASDCGGYSLRRDRERSAVSRRYRRFRTRVVPAQVPHSCSLAYVMTTVRASRDVVIGARLGRHRMSYRILSTKQAKLLRVVGAGSVLAYAAFAIWSQTAVKAGRPAFIDTAPAFADEATPTPTPTSTESSIPTPPRPTYTWQPGKERPEMK